MDDATPPPADPVPLDSALAGFRRSIDNFDAALVHILAERFRTTQAVGRYKAENALPPSDPGREEPAQPSGYFLIRHSRQRLGLLRDQQRAVRFEHDKYRDAKP